jgi:hypothetical protein
VAPHDNGKATSHVRNQKPAKFKKHPPPLGRHAMWGHRGKTKWLVLIMDDICFCVCVSSLLLIRCLVLIMPMPSFLLFLFHRRIDMLGEECVVFARSLAAVDLAAADRGRCSNGLPLWVVGIIDIVPDGHDRHA